ncbi:hypothetical protein WJ58_10475 [Burkholderia ubonensis]|nr:hypothetical protein WJ58_10475 [Burkholderia ubonensis]
MKLRMPTKLGYKNPKRIMEIFTIDTYQGGYWVDRGYNWFGGSRGTAARRDRSDGHGMKRRGPMAAGVDAVTYIARFMNFVHVSLLADRLKP